MNDSRVRRLGCKFAQASTGVTHGEDWSESSVQVRDCAGQHVFAPADEAESGSDGFVCKGGCVDDIGLSMPNGRRYDSLSVVGSCCSCPISSLAAACPSANQTKLNQLCDIAGDIGNAASADLWQPMLVDIQKFSVVEAQFA